MNLSSPALRVLLSGLLALWCTVARAQEHPEPDAIDRANRLGRMLHAYDQAAWHGTDAVMPLLRAAGANLSASVDGYVVEQAQDGWRVMFGRLSPDTTAYLVAYEARLDSAYQTIETAAYPEAERRTGFPVRAGHALSLAKQRFEAPEEVTYNTAVLPAGPDRVYVYFIPAQPARDVYYVGADFRYTFDGASGEIVETKRLHNAIITFDFRADSSAHSFASAVLTSVPTETDVFFAMSRPGGEAGRAHHFILTQDWVFLLDASGIVATMTREAWDTLEDE